jgi:tetratricopeptide (TPR) repeat protein
LWLLQNVTKEQPLRGYGTVEQGGGMNAAVLGIYALDLTAARGGKTGCVAMDDDPVLVFVMRGAQGRLTGQPLCACGMPSGYLHPVDEDDLLENYRPELGAPLKRIQTVAAGILRKMAAESARAGAVDKLYRHGAAVIEVAPCPQEWLDNDEQLLVSGMLAVMRHELLPAVPAVACDTAVLRHQGLHAALCSLVDSGQLLSGHLRCAAACAIACRKRGNHARAIEIYRQALALREDDHILFNLARALFESDSVQEAKHCLERALEINPRLEMAGRFLSFLQAAEQNG